MSKKMKFGMLCNSLEFEAWEVSCIDNLLNHPLIELKLLVINHQTDKDKPTFLKKLISYPYNNFLYRAYKRYWLKAASYQRVSLEQKLKNISTIKCSTIKKGKYGTYFYDQDIAHIKQQELDFMLRFGFDIIKGEILNCCRYGIWSFHHADSDYIRGGPLGFWEIYLKRNTTAAVLQQLNNQLDQGKILRKGYLKTIDHSYAENIDQLTEMAAKWPLQVCIDLINGINVIEKSPITTTKAKLYKYPSNFKFLRFIFILFCNKIKFHYNELFESESWQIARYDYNIDDLKKNKLLQASYMSASQSETYCADPFLWPNDSAQKIVYEFFSYQENCGKIAMSDFNGKDIKIIDFGIATHLSYPFLFEYEKQVYCLPEQAQTGHVSLFKIGSNGDVIKVTNLIDDFEARDSSLIFYNQMWWLFCTKANYFENAALFIYYANNLNESFIPHQNNPVKIDIQNARPAGNFIISNDILYRPAQNSAKHYGHKININKITKLSPTEFEEEITEIIDPKLFGNFKGIHHLSIQKGQTIVDLKQYKFSWYNFIHQLSRKRRKLLG